MRKSLTSLALAGALALGFTGCTPANTIENEFDGSIDGMSVHYIESSRNGCKMTVRAPPRIFVFEDTAMWNPIGSTNYSGQKLEVVSIIEGGKTNRYETLNETEPQALRDIATAKIFERGNQLYNHLRGFIREKSKHKYEGEEQKIPGTNRYLELNK